jgi:glycosyltransferase involved in cell wall biosynthesis
VQLILVNDGSPDGCGAICEAYKVKYPENVVYIEQVNRGVSAARNVGLDVAVGEFVAVLDGDDRLATLTYLENRIFELEQNKNVTGFSYVESLKDGKQVFCRANRDTVNSTFQISDEAIEKSSLTNEQKVALLSRIYPLQLHSDSDGKQRLTLAGQANYDVSFIGLNVLVVTQIYEKAGTLYIKLHDRRQLAKWCHLDIQTDFDYKVISVIDYPNRQKIEVNGEEYFPQTYCEIEIALPVDANGSIEFYLNSSLGFVLPAQLVFSQSANLGLNNNFFIGDTFFILKTNEINVIKVEPLTKDIIKTVVPTLIAPYVLRGKEKSYKPDSAFGELATNILRYFDFYSKRRIWLFMDRHMETDNNAEVLFRYCSNKNDTIEMYYVVPSEAYSKRFEGLKTVVFGTLEFKLLLIFAEKFISSFLFSEGIMLKFAVSESEQAALERVQNFRKLARQFFRGEIIHLQHGIIFGDISVYLNRRHERFSRILSVCERELDYIKTLDYAIPLDIVVLTGLPKYDELERIKSNRILCRNILFAPSFDRDVSAKDEYVPDYKYSANFRYINGVLNNVKLLEYLRENDYTLLFKPHYLMKNNLVDFDLNERVKFVHEDINRYELYQMSDLLITDYSGIAFEYAYLEKPLLYAHIARNTKFEETYFSYDSDGFGEISFTTDNLVESIIHYLDNGCEMPEMYKNRVNNFFTYHDTDNCKRAYESIVEIPATRMAVV